jgi:sugar lactone lactonase YvrE
MKNIITLFIIIYFSALIGVIAQEKKIEFEAPLVYPEGVAFNPKTNTYYVSSVTTGNIGAVDATGKYTIFHKDSTLKSTFGMKVDVKRNRLWVCAGDPNYSKFKHPSTFKKMAKVIALDLATGKRLATIDLGVLYGGNHFANDLTLDDKGNVYITDSFSPIIYKIDTKDQASVFAENDLFKTKDIGLNGIAYHPRGYLIAVNNGAGAILKIDLKNPKNVTKVKINQFFPGADGLLIDKLNNLILIQNKGVNKAFMISSNDEWKTATVKGHTTLEERFQNPTTATLSGDDVFVLNSKMNELSDSTKNPSKKYSIQLARFDVKAEAEKKK